MGGDEGARETAAQNEVRQAIRSLQFRETLRAHPGLTRKKLLAMMDAYGFLGKKV